jgi:hypothetical protein
MAAKICALVRVGSFLAETYDAEMRSSRAMALRLPRNDLAMMFVMYRCSKSCEFAKGCVCLLLEGRRMFVF